MCWTRLLLPSDPHPSCPRLSRACPCGHHPQVAFPGADGSSRAWSLSPGEAWVCGGCLTPRRPQLRSLACCLLQYMEKLSQLAYHPLKMQSCYEKMEPLRLDGLQQRFDVSSTSVFKQRAQIHMREVSLRLLPSSPHSPGHPTPAFCLFPPPPPPHSSPGPPRGCRAQRLCARSCSGLCALPSPWSTCPSVHLANSDSSFKSWLRDPFLQEALLAPQAPSCRAQDLGFLFP